jgi:hypothetical protein
MLDQPVLLYPSGSVTVRLSCVSSDPSGIVIQLRAVELASPLQGLRGQHEPVARVMLAKSGADGLLHIASVPVGRWVAQVQGYALLGSNPAPDPGYTLENGVLKGYSTPPPEKTTGVFEVLQGQDRLVEMELSRGSVVQGRLVETDSVLAEGVQIELISEKAIREDGMPRMLGRVARLVGTKLSFQFSDLQPGRYHINGVVVSAGDVYTLYHRRFELRPDESLDLGNILAEAGELLVRWETVDADTQDPNDNLRYWIESRCRIPIRIWAIKPNAWSYEFTTSPVGATCIRGVSSNKLCQAVG